VAAAPRNVSPPVDSLLLAVLCSLYALIRSSGEPLGNISFGRIAAGCFSIIPRRYIALNVRAGEMEGKRNDEEIGSVKSAARALAEDLMADLVVGALRGMTRERRNGRGRETETEESRRRRISFVGRGASSVCRG